MTVSFPSAVCLLLVAVLSLLNHVIIQAMAGALAWAGWHTMESLEIQRYVERGVVI